MMSPDLTSILRASRILIASDFDGTLAPIVSRPSDAVADPHALAQWHRLAKIPRVTLAIVSGRSSTELDSLCSGFPACWRVADHGKTPHAPDGSIPDTWPLARNPQHLGKVGISAELLAAQFPGATVESKAHGFAFHFRNVPVQARSALPPAVDAWIAESQRAGFEVLKGREVVEIQIPGETKYSALQRIANLVGPQSTIFAGDDTTDLEAVRELSISDKDFGVWVRSPERPLPDFTPNHVVEGPQGWGLLLESIASFLEGQP